MMCLLGTLVPEISMAQIAIPLKTPGFENNTSGGVFTSKISAGFDVATNDVAGWRNAGAGNTAAGVDYQGNNGLAVHSGTICAWSQGGQPGAYQITSYQIQAGVKITLTWWAKCTYASSAPNADQLVQLLAATNTSDSFSNLTTLAVSKAALKNTGNGGAYTQYTLTYIVQAADVGKYLAVSFRSVTGGNRYAAFDDFSLRVDSTEITLGPPTIVPIPSNPIYYYANDSVFPYLPNSNGTANITFWVDGVNFRSEGPSLDSMNPINPTTSVLSGTPGDFDNGGIWLTSVIRRSGVLFGFYHAEDHSCTNAYSEWNSSGLAISMDDGFTWSKQGQIIGNPNPCTGNGGINASTFAWDAASVRWIAWGGANCFVSSNIVAAPGTWYGYYNGSFSTPMPGTGSVSGLPTLSANISVQGVTWNSYLGQWFMVYLKWGQNTKLLYTTSPDGINWASEQVLMICPTNYTMNYPMIIGETSDSCGQDALLVYQRFPGTSPGRNRDMVECWIHWGDFNFPSAPTNLTAAGQYFCQSRVELQWNAAPQSERYIIYRSTSSGGSYTNIAEIATSASFPKYADTAVTEGTTYYYKVRSANTNEASAYSSIVMVTAPSATEGDFISVNFVGGSSGATNTLMDCLEVAGVISANDWNNAVGNTGALNNLYYNAGAASTASVTWECPNTWSIGNSSEGGNKRMMYGYLDGSATTITVSNIPSKFTNAGYDVYVYCDGDSYSGKIGGYTIGNTSIQATDTSNFSGSFVQANNSAGNYVVFTNLSASQFTLNTAGVAGYPLRAPVNGIQIVASGAQGGVQALSVVAPIVMKNPLAFSIVNDGLQLNWPSDYLGWRLQMQTNLPTMGLSTNWVDVPNSTQVQKMFFPINKGKNAFFRLVPN